MNQVTRAFFSMLILVSLILSAGCNHNEAGEASAREEQLDSCLGPEYNALLNGLTEAFGKFLIDNRFCRNQDELLSGYKNWLGYLMEGKGMDTSWKFRLNELETMLGDMEEIHFAEKMYEGNFTSCILDLQYPEDWVMYRYREIMPQHTVSPETFAREFINGVDDKQFGDPVIRKLVALEYFLGPILHILRPDDMYLASAR